MLGGSMKIMVSAILLTMKIYVVPTYNLLESALIKVFTEEVNFELHMPIYNRYYALQHLTF